MPRRRKTRHVKQGPNVSHRAVYAVPIIVMLLAGVAGYEFFWNKASGSGFGSLGVVGYYNGVAVAFNNAYYNGPNGQGTPVGNVLASGYTWPNLPVGTYSVTGTYGSTTKTSQTVVIPNTVTIDFGGSPPPSGNLNFKMVQVASSGSFHDLTYPTEQVFNGKIYSVVWQNGVVVTKTDVASGVQEQSYTLLSMPNSPPGSDADHAAGSINVDDNGFVYVTYGAHVGDKYLSISSSPAEVASWRSPITFSGQQQVPNTDVAGGTYSQTFIYNGNLYIFYREGNYQMSWGFKMYNIASSSMSGFTEVLNSDKYVDGDNYPKFLLKDGRMYIAWELRPKAVIYSSMVNLGFAYSMGITPSSLWFTATGVQLTLPFTDSDSASKGIWIHQNPEDGGTQKLAEYGGTVYIWQGLPLSPPVSGVQAHLWTFQVGGSVVLAHVFTEYQGVGDTVRVNGKVYHVVCSPSAIDMYDSNFNLVNSTAMQGWVHPGFQACTRMDISERTENTLSYTGAFCPYVIFFS